MNVRIVPSVPQMDPGLLDLAGFDLDSPWVQVYDLPLAVLELSTRPRNVFARAGIDSIGDLVARDDDDIIAMTMLGADSYVEVVLALRRFGLKLREGKRSALVIAQHAERLAARIRQSQADSEAAT